MSNITTLNGLAETIFSGLTAYGRSPIRNSGVPVAMINITDIQRGNLDLTELETVYADEAAKLERYQVKAGDVLITAKGSSFKSDNWHGFSFFSDKGIQSRRFQNLHDKHVTVIIVYVALWFDFRFIKNELLIIIFFL